MHHNHSKLIFYLKVRTWCYTFYGIGQMYSASGNSVGKESACNVGDPSSIPGSGRSIGEEIGYPLQYSWASLVAQLVKNAPAMRETWIPSLGWEDPLEKGSVTHSSILAWRISWTVCIVRGVATSKTRLSDFHFNSALYPSLQYLTEYFHCP